MSDAWFYFGCHERAGHFLFSEGMRTVYSSRDPVINAMCGKFDGLLCAPAKIGPYKAAISRLGGLGYSALAFWDYSVDDRGGSNSIFFAPDMSITADAFLQEAKRRFPQVFARLPQEVEMGR